MLVVAISLSSFGSYEATNTSQKGPYIPYLIFPCITAVIHVKFSHANEISKLWHDRFGHMNYRYLQTLHKEGMVEGLPQIQPSTRACIGSILSRATRRGS